LPSSRNCYCIICFCHTAYWSSSWPTCSIIFWNIYTCNINRNSSNIKGINIYDSNNSILASFDAFNKNIFLGSNVNPAISINNNVYTPDVIVCKYSYTAGTDAIPARITLNIISNIPINTSTFINLPIFDTFSITNFNQTGQANDISYSPNILKFKPAVAIVKNSLANITINLNSLSVHPSPSTTTGYITAI
jgi:hypothetical protein